MNEHGDLVEHLYQKFQQIVVFGTVTRLGYELEENKTPDTDHETNLVQLRRAAMLEWENFLNTCSAEQLVMLDKLLLYITHDVEAS